MAKTSVSMELNLNDKQLNQIVQKYISDCYRQSNICDKIYSYGTSRISKKIDQMVNDGSLVDAVAKQVARNISKDIPLERLMEFVDMDKLNEAVTERVTQYVINKIKFF